MVLFFSQFFLFSVPISSASHFLSRSLFFLFSILCDDSNYSLTLVWTHIPSHVVDICVGMRVWWPHVKFCAGFRVFFFFLLVTSRHVTLMLLCFFFVTLASQVVFRLFSFNFNGKIFLFFIEWVVAIFGIYNPMFELDWILNVLVVFGEISVLLRCLGSMGNT